MRVSEKMKQQWTNGSIGATNAFTVNGDSSSGSSSLLAGKTPNYGGINVNNTNNLFSLCGTYRSDASSSAYESTDSSFKVNAQATLKSRDSLNKAIKSVLAENGIQLNSTAKLTFTVGSDSRISVSGADAATKAKVEAALNGKAGLGATLVRQSVAVKLLNNKDVSQLQYDKWQADAFLKTAVGQNLSELSLENGQLKGANAKLTQMIESAAQSSGSDAKTVQEMIGTIKKVLAYGQKKIPDMKVSFDYQGAALIDKDVQYGFGPNQLKSWYGQMMAGASSSGSYRA